VTERVILLIEDEADIRTGIEEFLRSEGYAVHAADNGQSGLRLLGTIPRPDLVLLDLFMPVMDGWAFYDRVRRSPAWQDIPIVALTAASNRTAPPAGVEVFDKLADLDVLLSVVHRYV
jgi:CheY-like chemotaxis protein